MDKMLRLDDTDSRIDYGLRTSWTPVPNSGESWNLDGTYHHASAPNSQIFLAFRGTGISLYGRRGPGGGILNLVFDGEKTSVNLNSTDPGNNSTRLWSREGLGDGDHQFIGYTTATIGQVDANIWVDYFELENSLGTGFDPQWTGTNATNVPKDAIVVDNSDTNIRFSNISLWDTSWEIQYYAHNLLYTRKNGASLSYTFEGVAIWYYSDLDITHGHYTVSIDGSSPERLNGRNSIGRLTRQMLWSKTDLTAGQHTFTLTHDDTDRTFVALDYFRVLRSEDASALSSNGTAPTSPNRAPGPTWSGKLALAIGLPIGVLVLTCLVLFLVCYPLRRQRRTSVDPIEDAHKQAQGVLPPAGAGAAYTALPHVESFGSPEMNSVSMPPPYEEIQDNRGDAPRALKR